MRLFVSYTLGVALAFSAIGCGGGDSGTKDALAAANEGLDAMKSIKDEASAKEANGKLKTATEKIKAAAATMKQPSEDQKKAIGELGKKYKDEMERITKLPPAAMKECSEGILAFGTGVAALSMASAFQMK